MAYDSCSKCERLHGPNHSDVSLFEELNVEYRIGVTGNWHQKIALIKNVFRYYKCKKCRKTSLVCRFCDTRNQEAYFSSFSVDKTIYSTSDVMNHVCKFHTGSVETIFIDAADVPKILSGPVVHYWYGKLKLFITDSLSIDASFILRNNFMQLLFLSISMPVVYGVKNSILGKSVGAVLSEYANYETNMIIIDEILKSTASCIFCGQYYDSFPDFHVVMDHITYCKRDIN